MVNNDFQRSLTLPPSEFLYFNQTEEKVSTEREIVREGEMKLEKWTETRQKKKKPAGGKCEAWGVKIEKEKAEGWRLRNRERHKE